MGQFVSTSRTCNDDLVNGLVTGGYIVSKDVERVFRSVDRGFYFSNEERPLAYYDVAHHSDGIHLSAPAVYATVLECLKLQSGHKFLNIGSGVGYFSTAVGLMLGINGVNHGIEINKLMVDRAYQKMEEFKLHAAAVDFFNFCEPVFIHGNACNLLPTGYYDRVYCGASVPTEESEFMKSLINIGGILVMPLEGSLMKITRKTEHIWESELIYEVVFTDLVVPEKCSVNRVKFPTVEPSSLQELCKLNIRTALRENLERTQPNLLIRTHFHLKTTARSKKHGIIDDYVRLNSRHPSHQLNHLRDFANALLGRHLEIRSDISSSSSSDNDDNNLEQLEDNFYEAVRAAEARTTVSAEARVAAAAAALAAAEARAATEVRTAAEARVAEMHLAQCSHLKSTSVDESSTSTNESTKRKSQDYAEGSKSNTASAATKNSKRIKMDIAFQNNENIPSTSLECDSDSGTTLSTDFEGLVSADDCSGDDESDNEDDVDESISTDDVDESDGEDDVDENVNEDGVDKSVNEDDVDKSVNEDDVGKSVNKYDVDESVSEDDIDEGDSDDDIDGGDKDDINEGDNENDLNEGDNEDEATERDDEYYINEDEDYYVDTSLSTVVNSYFFHDRTEMNDENEHFLANEELMGYRFVTDRKENEFSKLLKVEINSLPIPNPLKVYLNYNRID